MIQTSPPSVMPHNPAQHTVRVLESRMITPSVRMLRLEKPPTYTFQVSQATRLFLDTPNGIERHTLSMASSPQRDYMEFAAKQTHSDWKKLFFTLQPGDPVNIEGPVGKFFFNEQQPAILIAGGIGITPFKSMMEYATDVKLRTPITLLYSNRTVDEIAFKQELAAMALVNPQLNIIHTLTRHQPPHTWDGRVGRIDETLLRQVSHQQPHALYYICGTPSMIEDTVQMLHDLGVASERIRLETFKGYARHAANF